MEFAFLIGLEDNFEVHVCLCFVELVFMSICKAHGFYLLNLIFKFWS